MLCEHCKQNEATTHIKKNVNGTKTEMHLCSECAKKLNVMEEFTMPRIDNFFGNFLGAGLSAMNSLAGVERCDSCGASFHNIVNSGRVGCADCYNKFSDRLEPSIQKIHGKTKHVGKFITYTEEGRQEEQPGTIDSLKDQLKLAVKEQRFEDAAVLRDKIKEINPEA